jgi:Xaa-Pro aminopeptidase
VAERVAVAYPTWMPGSDSVPFPRRLARTRLDLHDASLDVLLVTHLPNIRYLTGFHGSAGALVVAATGCLLVVDTRYASAARLLLTRHADLARHVEIVVAERTLDDAIMGALTRVRASRVGIEATSMSVARFQKLESALLHPADGAGATGGVRPVLIPTERVVERARLVKDDEEIRTMREAGRKLATLAGRLESLVRPGRSEMEIAAELDAGLREIGFERPAFETIVASGPNGALPHARPGRRRLEASDGVVLDFGGVYDGYCVDLTRTVQLGDGTAEFRRILAAVSAAHIAAIEAIRPGIRASSVDAAARRSLERDGLAGAFGHGTGHGLGLEVHEEPRISRYTPGQPDPVLEPGMIFTVEPGVYLDGIGGARIEDDVLVTEAGCEVLTRA